MYIKSGLNIENITYNKNIICVGTILENIKGILAYLKEFNHILYNIVDIENRELYGTDSGVNYYIIYGNLLKNIKIYTSSNNEKLVYTMAFPNYLNLINYNFILNEKKQICYDKDVCYCIHQYDRLDNEIKKNILLNKNYNFII